MKERFMKSPHIIWAKFAEAEGIPYHYRNNYPVGEWQNEKRKGIADRESDELTQMLFDRRYKWHRDVLHTLEQFPKIADQIILQLNRKLEHIRGMSAEEFNYGRPLLKDKDGKVIQTKTRQVSLMDMHMLSLAYKAASEAKMKLLLIDNWNIRVAEDETKPVEKEATDSSKGMVIEVIGKGQMALTDIEKMMAEYLDKPPKELPDEPT